MTTILVIAPHPDDETLGCGGSLLRHVAEGDAVHWLIITSMTEAGSFSAAQIKGREQAIAAVAQACGFAGIHQVGLPTTRLDTVPMVDLVKRIGAIVKRVEPTTMYLPFAGDAHSDHRITFEAAAACTKWFRHGSVRRVLAYETLSETDFGLDPDRKGFRPNVYIDISGHLEKKLEIMHLYDGELAAPPFPRSAEAVRALAALRGSAAGCGAAEAFMLLKETRLEGERPS